MLLRIKAENTLNGNPQRGWIHVDNEGNFLKFYDEGYDDGGLELRNLRMNTFEALPINVTVKEYKRIKGLSA